MAVGRCVGDVAGTEERGGGEAAAHADQVVGAVRQQVGRAASRQSPSTVSGPGRIGMAIVPGDIFVDHRACGGMRRDVVDQAFAHDPDPTPVAKGLAVVGAGSHDAFSLFAVV